MLTFLHVARSEPKPTCGTLSVWRRDWIHISSKLEKHRKKCPFLSLRGEMVPLRWDQLAGTV